MVQRTIWPCSARCWAVAVALFAALAIVPSTRVAASRQRRHTLQRRAHEAAQRQRTAYVPSVSHKVVAAGDTLWDLCGEVTGKPWLWPQVWALNPQVHNPHWLYPGDVIAFTEAGRHPLPANLASDIDLPPQTEADGPILSEAAHKAPNIEIVAHGPAGQITDKRRRPQHLFVGEFIGANELKHAGEVTRAAADKLLLRAGDDLFISVELGTEPNLGEKYYLFRTGDEVTHPATGSTWGYRTEVTGIATVTAVHHGVARARLEHTTSEVERGQHALPYTSDFLVHVEPRDAHKRVYGVILAVEGERPAVGEQSLVFVDKGRVDGVEVGTALNVRSRADAVLGIDPELPTLDMGTLMVVDVKERTSTCLVVDTLYEIWPGDHFHASTVDVPSP